MSSRATTVVAAAPPVVSTHAMSPLPLSAMAGTGKAAPVGVPASTRKPGVQVPALKLEPNTWKESWRGNPTSPLPDPFTSMRGNSAPSVGLSAGRPSRTWVVLSVPPFSCRARSRGLLVAPYTNICRNTTQGLAVSPPSMST